jgi:hypothetical protein
MRIKHSKYRNTGLIYELLVKQIASDVLESKESDAIQILKKYYSGKTTLAKEYKLYEFVVKNNSVSQSKAETIISTITEVSRKFNQKILKEQKYALISEIKSKYNIDEFFTVDVRDYKALASLYCLLEAQNNSNLVDPSFLINNKTTLLEHLTSKKQNEEDVKDSLIEQYGKYDKDLKLLTFKILLEKFNEKYANLLPEQKYILKEFITSVNSSKKLFTLVNKELSKISEEVKKLGDKVTDDIIKIKLDEVSKSIQPLKPTDKVKDTHLVNLMQYYELVNELNKL